MISTALSSMNALNAPIACGRCVPRTVSEPVLLVFASFYKILLLAIKVAIII